MTTAPTPPNPSELIDRFISQLPDKIKLWRFVGKMAVDQVNKRLIDQVDNYSTRQPSDPPVTPKTEQQNSKIDHEARPKVTNQPTKTRTKLPIDNYDDLSALQILELLSALNKTELAKIKKYETAHRARQTILKKITALSNASK